MSQACHDSIVIVIYVILFPDKQLLQVDHYLI